MGGNIIGQPVQRLKLRKMESMMKQNVWVKNAEMFFDNLQVLQVSIEEREPVARLFQVNGASFYIDTALSFLPLSTKLSARVPVFTNLPIQKQKDSLLLKQIIEMAAYINADSFFTAQISQINISAENHFEIVPLIGDHIVYFGDASDIRAKFKKLNAFYRSAWLERGIYTYEKLDIQYKNQVIGIKKGTAQMYADSAAAIKLMQLIDTTKLDTIQKILLPLNNKQNPIPLTSKRNTL
jgi:cell division protein FtsQ